MTTDLLNALFPTWWAAAITAIVMGGIAWFILVPTAAKRTLKQPLLVALSEETTLLAGVLCGIRRYPFVSIIDPIAFSAAHHHNIWAALKDVLGDHANYPDSASDQDLIAAGEKLDQHQHQILTSLQAHLQQRSISPATDLQRLQELLQYGKAQGFGKKEGEKGVAQIDADIISAAESVIYAAKDRDDRGGIGLIVPGVNPNSLDPKNPPLVREYTPATTKRLAVTSALAAIAGALIPGFVNLTGMENLGAAAAFIAFAALIAGTIILALVDIDTFYIDNKTWLITAGATWSAAMIAALAVSDLSKLLYGIILVALVGGLLEGSNAVLKFFFKKHGQGFGDTLIIALTCGIPVALTGDWRIGYWAIIAGSLLAGIGWVVGFMYKRKKTGGAFAFGPWLAAGWVVAMCYFAYDTLAFGALV